MRIQGGFPLRTLLIECVTDTAFVAAHASGRYAHKLSPGKATHSTRLFQLIDESLAECGIKIRDVELICAGIGPGSITGIRIGLSTARMLSQVLSVPLIGIKSTELFAASLAQNPGDKILVAFDAKKGRVFGALYSVDDTLSLREIIQPGDYYPEEIISHFNNDGKIIMAGDGAEKYNDCFTAHASSPTLIPGFMPDGKHAVDLVIKKFSADPKAFSNPEKVLPFYARKSDAEVLKEEKEKNLT